MINEAAAGVLRREIAAGSHSATFYGAAHMPDPERRLVEDVGLDRQGAPWREAWNLSDKMAAK